MLKWIKIIAVHFVLFGSVTGHALEYEEVELTVNVQSNWPAEHCVETHKGLLSYSFKTPYMAKFGTHLHNHLGTTNQISDLIVNEYQTDLEIESDGGHFCLTWERTQDHKENWSFILRLAH
ncbi:MAG: hypothetical protein KUG82_00815 [Pseudomonadales bacterium]|nr:hypothetical protein [Pseudomonadales bacterium]